MGRREVCAASAVRAPGARLAAPRALVAVPAQQRLGWRTRLHEAVERRGLEAVALAAGLVARRHQQRRRGSRGRAGEQHKGGDAPDRGRWHSHVVTSADGDARIIYRWRARAIQATTESDHNMRIALTILASVGALAPTALGDFAQDRAIPSRL